MNRRSALTRILGIGAATVAASVVPEIVQARPQLALVPASVAQVALPEPPGVLQAAHRVGLAHDVSELAGHLDRLLAALPHVHADPSSWECRWLTGLTGAVANLAEETAGLRPAEVTAPIPPRVQEPKQPKREHAAMVGSDRIMVVRIPRLNVQQRRQVRRWLTTLPKGEHEPLVFLRLGERHARSGQRDSDYLDVVAPKWSDRSPYDHAHIVSDAYHERFGGTDVTTLCAHDAPSRPGARATIALYPDGRRARYADEVRG